MDHGFADHAAPTDLEAARQRVRAEAEAVAGSSPIITLDERRPPAESITDDAACVIADFVLWRWPPDRLTELSERLRPDRVLYFLEPTADLGWRRMVHTVGRPLWRARLGHDFSADVPAALRAAGLLVGTTDRFSLGPAGVRSYVWGRAEHLSRR